MAKKKKKAGISLEELPCHVLAAVLGGFCSGKTISTFLTTARSNHILRPSALSLCRGVLVQRFIELAATFVGQPEIKDVIDVVREDCRLSEDDQEDIVTKMSEWCAVLDYFEIHRRIGLKHNANSQFPTQWIVWRGSLHIPYGETRGFIATPNWRAGSLRYWRDRELTHLNLSYTRNQNLVGIHLPYYGLFLGASHADDRRLELQNRDLMQRTHVYDDNRERELVSTRSAIIPMEEAYEPNPTMALARRSHQHSREGDQTFDALECFWDSEDGEEGDWEESVAGLGDAVIRIMSKTSTYPYQYRAEARSFESCLESVYDNVRASEG